MNLNQETEVIPSVDTKDSKSDQEYVTNSLSCRRWYVKKIMHFLTYVTIEPLVALTAIASSIQSVVIQRLVRDATCLKTYGFQDEYCANVTNETINLELKGIQADYNFYFVLLEISPYIFLSLFLGAWSDQHGAKFLILVSIGTNMISSMSFAIIAHLKYVHPAFILIGPTIKGLTGSHKTFHLAIDNYAVINSTKKGRTAKIAMIDLAFSLGAPTGYLLGGALYGKGNYTLVFSISLLLNLVAMLYAFLRLRKLPLTSTSTSVAFQNLFKIHHLKDAFCVLTTKRPENKRLFLILTIIASKLHQFPNSGIHAIHYPFTQVKFDFTVQQFSILHAYSCGITGLGSLFGFSLLSYLFQISDFLLGLLSVCMTVISNFVTAFSLSPAMLYTAATLDAFMAGAYICCRSLMSKYVHYDEQGKLIAIYGLFSSVIPVLAGLLYDKVFRATMATFPGTCYVMSVGFNFLSILLFIWMYCELRKHNPMPEFEVNDEFDVLKEAEEISAEHNPEKL